MTCSWPLGKLCINGPSSRKSYVQSASPISTYSPRMNGIASMYARPNPRLGVLSTRAPLANATSEVASLELSTIRISPHMLHRRRPSRHQSTNCAIVSSSLSAGITIESSGSATSFSGTSNFTPLLAPKLSEMEFAIANDVLVIHFVPRADSLPETHHYKTSILSQESSRRDLFRRSQVLPESLQSP